METKANTALIGGFTLVVIALAFVFVYWLARGSEQGSNVPLSVVFQDPVTGLAVGSLVVFNGITIGTVKSLSLDPDRPNVVIAGLSVQPLRSIKKDTEVTLGFQGLTGVGYVEMKGGSRDRPAIWEEMPEGPSLLATRSSMQDLMAGARTILARTDQTLKSVETIVSDNVDDIGQAVRDVRKFTGALAENSDAVANLIQNVSAASAGIADATKRLDGIVSRSERLLDATDPAQVRAALDNIVVVTQNLATQSQNLQGILERADKISMNIEGFSDHLPALGEHTDALLAAIDPERLASTLERINTIVAAIEPDKIGTTVDGLSSLAETIQANRANIDQIVTKVASVTNDLAAFSSGLPAMGERTNALMAAVDPDSVAQALANFNVFTGTLAQNSEEIDAIIADARGLSGRFQKIGDDAEALLTKLNSMAGEGTGGLTEDLQETLAAVRDAANAFSKQVTAVGGGVGDFSDRGLRDIQNLISEGQRTIARLDSVINSLEQNPSGFIFGGENVPEYSGQRR